MAQDISDTSSFDIKEKIDILLKATFGVPSTSDSQAWYNEDIVKFNNYLFGDEIFLDNIPDTPDFNISGTVVDPSSLGLTSSDFMDMCMNENNKTICSIVDDSTGTIRRYQNLILQHCPISDNNLIGDSWFRVDNSGINILKDSFQFNYKSNNNIKPYNYELYSRESFGKSFERNMPYGIDGGNWFFDVKSGILLFLDKENFLSNSESEYNIMKKDSQGNFTNPPVLTFYKYIGRKGIKNINNDINEVNQNISIISTQDYLMKNDIIYNSTLIDNNNITINTLENKLNNLVNILNNQLGLNININTL